MTAGCGGWSSVTLRESPPDFFLLSLKSGTATVNYDFHSYLPGPYVFTNNGGYEFFFRINSAYQSNLQMYFETRFQQFNDTLQKPYHVSISLESVSMDYGFNQSTVDVIEDWSDALSRHRDYNVHGEGVVNCEIHLRVTVTREGKILGDKLIRSIANSSQRFSSSVDVESIYAAAANDSISKSLIFIDKYLSSLGI